MSNVVFAGQGITTATFNNFSKQMVTQSADQEVQSSTAVVPTEIIIPLEPGATYWYQLVATYSAVNTSSNGGGGFRWSWDVPTGTAMPRQTAAMALGSVANLNAGQDIILRSPAASTDMRAEGINSDASAFMSVHEYGCIQVGGQSGNAVLQFAQWASHATPTVLRGLLRTRAFYQRVQ